MGEVTIQKLKAITGQFDPDLIYKVQLPGLGLAKIPASLSMCPNLTVLDLSFNSLTSVEDLEPLKFLKTLVLFDNKIEKLESFERLYALEQLYLQKNKIKFMNEISHLSDLPNLKVLSLQSLAGEERNPVCDMSSPSLYRDTIMQKLPQLQVLDEARVSSSSEEFYSVVRDHFDLEPEPFFVDTLSNWSKELPWKDQPIHVKVQLDSSAFKATVVGCNNAMIEADKEIEKAREILKKAKESMTTNQEQIQQNNEQP